MQPLTIQKGLNAVAKRDFKALHTHCIDALRKDVKDPVAYFLLGAIALEQEDYQQALEMFTTAESHDRTEAYYPAYLARTLTILRRQKEARAAADRAVAMSTDNAYIQDTIGLVYSRIGCHELAIPMFKRAIELKPDSASMHFNLGTSAQFVGNRALAANAYIEAIKIQPEFYRAWSSLVYLSKQTERRNFLNKLIKLYENKEKNSDAQLQLGHAIAKTYEDLGDFKTSLNWLHRAKMAKKFELPCDRASGAAIFAAARHTLKQPRSSGRPDTGRNSAVRSLFIVGLPRTGITLVDRILCSHSQVGSTSEPNIFAELIKKHSGTKSKLTLDAATLERATANNLSEIGRQYLEVAARDSGNSEFTVDKTALNLFYAGLIHRALPDARIIAVRRDAMDSCVSNFRQMLPVSYSFYNYTYDLGDVAWFYRQFDALMTHWRSVLSADHFMEVQYEDIVYHQQRETRRLLEFCGLEWQDACLNFDQDENPATTADSVQVGQPLHSNSIGRWKKYGNELAKLKAAIFGPAES